MALVSYTFPQLLNFTRTTAGTYVNSSGFITNTPASTNLLIYTQEFGDASWVSTTTTVVANSIAAPDGTMTADTITANGANSTQLQTFTASAVPYTFSVYLLRRTGSGNVDITVDGVTYATQTINSTTWTRCQITTTPTAGSKTAGIRIATTNDAVYAWGAQLEQASTASTYTRNFGGVFPPRFEYDPVTLAAKGILIEASRTNLMLRSLDVSNTYWLSTAVTKIVTPVTSPDGTANAYGITENTAASTHAVQANPNPTVSASTTYTTSMYVKRASGTRSTYIQVNLAGGTAGAGTAWFNLDTGVASSITTLSGTFVGVSAGMQDAGNGWYRCWMTYTTNAGNTSALSFFGIYNTSTGGRTYTGNGTSGLYLWGMQLEAGPFPSSLIITTTSTVTRTADILSISAPMFSSWYNSTAGSFVVSFDTYSAATSVDRPVLSFDDSTSKLIVDIAPTATVASTFDGSSTLSATGSAVVGTVKVGMAYSATDRAIVTNGGTVATGSAPAAGFSTATALTLSGSTSNTGGVRGHLQSVRYYPIRLTNVQLQALTV